jgi:hypothetical protein
MSHREFHVMTVERLAERQVTRYSCPTCQRCVEDGPEGITLLYRGDQDASHRGGSLRGFAQDFEQQPPLGSKAPATLH